METTLSSSADLSSALAVAEESLLPAPIEKIEDWLGELSAITARRSETAIEAEISLSAYSSRLTTYPGDIVRDTLLTWSGKWFPTWGELKEIMDARTAPRTAIRDAVLKVLNPPAPPRDVTLLKRELANLQDGNIPREWAFKDRTEQLELIDARILTLKTQIIQIEG